MVLIQLDREIDGEGRGEGEVAEAELANLRFTAVLGWENKSFPLFGEMFELPLLELDYPAISDFETER